MRISKKQVIIMLLFIFIALIVFLSYSFFANLGKTKINVVVAPKDATVYIDGVKHRVGASNVTPGGHSIRIERKGFDLYRTSVNAQKSKTADVITVLTPNSSEGTDYETEHANEFKSVGKLANEQNVNNEAELLKSYPIINKLPMDLSPAFRIDYGQSIKHPNDPTKIALFIAATIPSDKQSALTYLYSQGFDPSDYEIVFKDLVDVGADKNINNTPIGD